jgi:hypothetical protein
MEKLSARVTTITRQNCRPSGFCCTSKVVQSPKNEPLHPHLKPSSPHTLILSRSLAEFQCLDSRQSIVLQSPTKSNDVTIKGTSPIVLFLRSNAKRLVLRRYTLVLNYNHRDWGRREPPLNRLKKVYLTPKEGRPRGTTMQYK